MYLTSFINISINLTDNSDRTWHSSWSTCSYDGCWVSCDSLVVR